MIGSSTTMQAVFKMIGRLASQDVNVLILGETGTGKELIAQALHRYSQRAHQPFLTLNCAAIPDTLLESELFGHERGAFTGAEQRRIGKFEQCHQGTMFLDEVGDMAPTTQAKMLRLLQQGAFERVGGTETIHVNVRILAATNKDLPRLVKQEKFRADLYHRLNSSTITLPALRHHPEDIPVLANHFLRCYSHELAKPVEQIDEEVMIVLQAYQWPGNIRELQNVIRASLVNSSGTILRPEFLPPSIAESLNSQDMGGETFELNELIDHLLTEYSTDIYRQFIAQVRPHLMTKVLSFTNGNQTDAAGLLGLSRVTMRQYLREDGLSVSRTIQENGKS